MRRIPHFDLIILLAGLLLAAGFFWYASPPPDANPPAQKDLPFDAFHPLRQEMVQLADNSITVLLVVTGAVLAALWLIAWRERRLRQAASATVAIGCAAVALQGQVFLMTGSVQAGALLYLIAASLFAMWVFVTQVRGGRSATDLAAAQRTHISPRLELGLLAVVMLIAVFARFYDLKRVPYGVDGDEAIWTIELVSSRIDAQNTLSSNYHYRNLPMSYWMQTPFQWLFGPSLTAGRIEVAFFSVVASLLFYYLARELFDVPTALLAALLLAVSLPDLSASRTANIQAHFKIWAVLPLLGIIVALRTRRLRDFFLTGLACAGAMLLYETVLLPIAAAGLFAVVTALREWRNWRSVWGLWARRFGVMLAPMAVTALITVPYLLGRNQYYAAYRGVAARNAPINQLLQGLQGVFASFYKPPLHDALFNRDGPYINGLLVPLLVLGIVYAVVTIKRPGSLLLMLWIAFVFFPVPIYLSAPLPRLYYPALPALYLLIALASMAIYRVIDRVVQRPQITVPIGVALLGVFVLLNLTIWFQEVKTPEEATQRRQVAEIVARQVDPNSLLLLPYDPTSAGEPVLVEQNLMQLFVRERRGVIDAGEFRAVPLAKLLPLIALEGPQHREVKVLHDLTQDPLRANRQAIVDALQRCYPDAEVDHYAFFELYHLRGTDLNLPACHSGLLSTDPIQQSEPGQSITIRWSLDPTPAARADLFCGKQRPDLVWVEAESFPPQNGWIVDNHFVTGWSGTGYLADAPDSTTATTVITVPRDSTYHLWVRSYRRQDDPFPAYLDFNDHHFEVAPTSLGKGQWIWQPLGELQLTAGAHPMTFTRPFEQQPGLNYMALFIDALVLSPSPDYDPNRDERWLPMLNTAHEYPNRALSGTFDLDLKPGTYRCNLWVSDGDRLVDGSGAIGIRSQLIFDVK